MKDIKYQTKRGYYLDYMIKVAKQLPGPDKRNNQVSWVQKRKGK